MAAGLLGGYGAFGAIAARYLYPARPDERRWQFVCELGRLRVGESLVYTAPAGDAIYITRQGPADTGESFIALSSTCPHLGCQVHWEGHNNRYFCPCHSGTFDPSGGPTGGPPFEANQSLPRFPLRVDRGLLFIEVRIETLVAATSGAPGGPGARVTGTTLRLWFQERLPVSIGQLRELTNEPVPRGWCMKYPGSRAPAYHAVEGAKPWPRRNPAG